MINFYLASIYFKLIYKKIIMIEINQQLLKNFKIANIIKYTPYESRNYFVNSH
jgi:hypothetical protein